MRKLVRRLPQISIESGFTLIELLVVLVIVAFMFLGLMQFMTSLFRSHTFASNTTSDTQQSQRIVARMMDELRFGYGFSVADAGRTINFKDDNANPCTLSYNNHIITFTRGVDSVAINPANPRFTGVLFTMDANDPDRRTIIIRFFYTTATTETTVKAYNEAPSSPTPST